MPCGEWGGPWQRLDSFRSACVGGRGPLPIPEVRWQVSTDRADVSIPQLSRPSHVLTLHCFAEFLARLNATCPPGTVITCFVAASFPSLSHCCIPYCCGYHLQINDRPDSGGTQNQYKLKRGPWEGTKMQQEASGPDMGVELSQGTQHRQMMPFPSLSLISLLLPLPTKTQQDNQEEREWGLVL